MRPEEFAPPAPTDARFGRSPLRFFRAGAVVVLVLVVLAACATLFARQWLRHSAQAALPALDGTLHVAGLAAPVTVLRDAQGVPHIRAASLDDLALAQGYVTAQDRLFQMELLRRHSAGTLAEILGPQLLEHDKLQRILQVGNAADNVLKNLPPDQLHLLERYAAGVNASIAAQSANLPLDFKLINAKPAPWTTRDCVLVALVLFEDLTDSYPVKLAREDLTAKLRATVPPNQFQAMVDDLYPVGSWRDHPPTEPVPDLTIPGPPVEDAPLDESQTGFSFNRLPDAPARPPTAEDVVAEARTFLDSRASCAGCVPGSNDWVVSGAHTASGKPMLSNDMHLAMTVPGIWYEADLEAPSPDGGEPYHAAGVTLPGLPLVVVGHNAHVAWGFTNSGADVQDVYIETLRGTGDQQQFRTARGDWQPVLHIPERIRVKGRTDTVLDVTATRHGDLVSPILTPAVPHETRPLALCWTMYDASIVKIPFLAINTARTGAELVQAFSTFGGPSQNLVYADDAGHIGYHTVGAIPIRGATFAQPALGNLRPLGTAPALPYSPDARTRPQPANTSAPTAKIANPLSGTGIAAPVAGSVPMLGDPLSPVPVAPTAETEWAGYIPYDRLPEVVDPPGGVIATANARITPGDYPYPIALNWEAPYRNERLWHLLGHRTGLTPADMLAIQMDVYSDFDHVLAERLSYALDHSDALAHSRYGKGQTRSLHQAADLLRTFNGRMNVDSPAAAITWSVRNALWPALLGPHLLDSKALQASGRTVLERESEAIATRYNWGERDYALEQLLMHQPPRWLPVAYSNWNDFLTDTVARTLELAHAPGDLSKWRYGNIHTLQVTDPVLGQTGPLKSLLGRPIGTGERPLSGDSDTVKQVGHAFGPSERLTVDLGDLDRSTLNLTLGQSGQPASPYFLDQFQAWYRGTTYPLAFSDAAAKAAAQHTLTLVP